MAGRTDGELEDLVGFFTNTLVLRNDTSGNPTIVELLARTRATALDAFAHQELPFERLVELLNPERSLAHHPLFQVMVALDHGAMDPDQGAFAEEMESPFADIAKFDLSFDFEELRGANGAPAGLALTVEYATDLFEHATAHAMAERLVWLLGELADRPGRRLSELDPLPPNERRLLTAWNGADAATPALDLLGSIEWAARQHPQTVAVSGDRVVTYQQLADNVRGAAAQLARLGVGADTIVVLLAPRSAWYVTMATAIVTAGAAYLPVDPETHPTRVAQMAA